MGAGIERFHMPTLKEIHGPVVSPVVSIFGVGGDGVREINRMIALPLSGVNFIGLDTDIGSLSLSHAETRILLGRNTTKGLGSMGRAELGRKAAFEALGKTERILRMSDLVFIVAGLGGGTGTGAAPVLAQACRELGVFTVAVVTRPVDVGKRKMDVHADAAIRDLSELTDTLIVLPESNGMFLRQKPLSRSRARKGSDLIAQVIKGISDLITQPGLIGIDLADVTFCLHSIGRVSLIVTEVGNGDEQAVQSVIRAISRCLFRGLPHKEVRTLLVNIISGLELRIDMAMSVIDFLHEYFPEDTLFLCEFTTEESMGDQFRVTLVGG
jgi:cell division protein FtsZ